ncbi:hypothetical protein Ccrd_009182 [Cynara cardunculus var. scolymus]|uniref:Amino acid transporter transmembrane domain-containing protein n=1 Tax=Cynara cardunculus var. scolymus TaxID=59895 RepID=A0A103YNK3_CYNCS|nr:hypothetical protein Ccrd_009182 [Cynara cardunculus var. scolymus]
MASTRLPPIPDNFSGDGGDDGKEVSAVTVDDSFTSTRGSWKHAAFHVATTIATPAAYAPLPFAVSSLGWPLGVLSLVGATLTTWYSSILIASLWKWDGKKHTTYRHLARSIYGKWGYWSIAFFQQVASLGNNIAIQIAAGSSLKKIDRRTVNYSLHGSSSAKVFKAFNGLGIIAFSFGNAMLPEIQSTVREPVKKTMYKGIAAAYSIILLSYWQLAFLGYWAFGSGVHPFIVASLETPEWTIVMANLFAEKMESNEPTHRSPLRNHLLRLVFTSLYMGLITLVAAAMPFFGDFVSICGAIGFTPLDFVFPVLAHLKAGRMPKHSSPKVILNVVIATWFSAVAVMGCIGAVKFIIEDVKTYKN